MQTNQPNPFRKAVSRLKALFGAKPAKGKAEAPRPAHAAPVADQLADWTPRWIRIADRFVRDPSQRNRLAKVYGLPTPPTKNDTRTMRAWVLRCYSSQHKLPI